VWRLRGADEDGRGVLGSVLGEQPPRTPGDGVEKKIQAGEGGGFGFLKKG